MINEKKFLNENGYLIIKNFFSDEQVNYLRSLCLSEEYKKKQSVILGDIITHKSFREVIFSKNLISLLKKIIGEDITYIGGDGSARGNDIPFTKKARKFHADSRADDFDFNKEYPLYRLGIYLQDTESFSGGLKIRPRSHKKLCIDHGSFFDGFYRFIKYIKHYKKLPKIDISKGLNIKANARDLIIWNMRLHHSGHAIRLKFLANLSLYPFLENLIPNFFSIAPQKNRCVLFFAFGLASNYLEDYYCYVNNHPSNKESLCNGNFNSNEVKEFCEKNDFKIKSFSSNEILKLYKQKKFF